MKRYTTITIGFVLLLLAGTSVFNAWVDPFAIYRWREVPVEDISKINQGYAMRLSKPWQLVRLEPSAIILGSSRSGSLRASHPAWEGEAGFNLSMPGLTAYEMLRLVEHAHAQGRLRKLVLGLEHESFLLAQPRVQVGFEEARLVADNGDWLAAPQVAQLGRDLQVTLLTGAALSRSFQVIGLPAPEHRRFHADGSWSHSAPARGGKAGFVYSGRVIVDRLQLPDDGLNENLALLTELLHFCHLNDIDTRLYVSPEHLLLGELRVRVGGEPAYQEFHRRLLAVNVEVAAHLSRKPFPVRGFNQLEGVVDQPLYPGVGGEDDWFWDGMHFHPRLGVRLMDGL